MIVQNDCCCYEYLRIKTGDHVGWRVGEEPCTAQRCDPVCLSRLVKNQAASAPALTVHFAFHFFFLFLGVVLLKMRSIHPVAPVTCHVWVTGWCAGGKCRGEWDCGSYKPVFGCQISSEVAHTKLLQSSDLFTSAEADSCLRGLKSDWNRTRRSLTRLRCCASDLLYYMNFVYLFFFSPSPLRPWYRRVAKDAM